MRLADSILSEMDQEAQTTKRVLERVPEGKYSWRPHPKSFSLGQLALHIASVQGSVAALAAQDTHSYHDDLLVARVCIKDVVAGWRHWRERVEVHEVTKLVQYADR